jgi:hypothetical protein
VSAPVTREHRVQTMDAIGCSYTASPNLPEWHARRHVLRKRAEWVETGACEYGVFEVDFGEEALDVVPIAQAIADAEARGRAAERADVVAWLQAVKDGTRACRDWVRHDVERGCHVGSATVHADSGSSSDEPDR